MEEHPVGVEPRGSERAVPAGGVGAGGGGAAVTPAGAAPRPRRARPGLTAGDTDPPPRRPAFTLKPINV